MAEGSVEVKEGQATLYFASQKGVFYNPPQIPNRDLSVLALRRFVEIRQEETLAKRTKQAANAASRHQADGSAGMDPPGATAEAPSATPALADAPLPGLRVLDALSASGLRAMRYTKEVPGLQSVVANDLDPAAVAVMEENFRRNELSAPQVVPSTSDAVLLLHQSKPPAGERFDVVDLDPYGTAAPFLDGAVQAVAEGGLLMVTCTDLAVLAGTYPEKCYAQYGSFPLKGKYCHEAALRIVLSCIEGHANRHRRYIVPLLSVHINFYVRLFVRVFTGPGEVKKSASKQSYLYQCSGCESYAMQPVARLTQEEGAQPKFSPAQGPPVQRNCAQCDSVHHVGGPMWTAPMHDPEFVRSLLERLDTVEYSSTLASRQRLVGLLTSVAEELHDVPLFYPLDKMCNTLRVQCPPLLGVFSALMRQGYRVSRSHTESTAIKTDAPSGAVWDVLRSWAAANPPTKLSETSPGHRLLAKPYALKADFSRLAAAEQLLSKKDAKGAKLARFMPNPAEWGPGSKGTAHAALGEYIEASPSAPASVSSSSASEMGGRAGAAAAGVPGPTVDTMLDKRAANQGKRSRKRATPEEGADNHADVIDVNPEA